MRSAALQSIFYNHLSETNTLTTQGNNILHYLGVTSTKPIFFDEVRHPTYSGRYLNSVKKISEKKNLKEEFASKYV